MELQRKRVLQCFEFGCIGDRLVDHGCVADHSVVGQQAGAALTIRSAS